MPIRSRSKPFEGRRRIVKIAGGWLVCYGMGWFKRVSFLHEISANCGISHGVGERFLRPEHRGMVLVEADPEMLLDRFAAYQPPQLGKWIDRGGT